MTTKKQREHVHRSALEESDVPINFIRKQPSPKERVTLPKTVLKLSSGRSAAIKKRRGFSHFGDDTDSLLEETTQTDITPIMRGRFTEMGEY